MTDTLKETAAVHADAMHAAAEETKRVREARIAHLIAQDVVLTARAKAVKRLKEPLRAELLLLLKQAGYTHRRTGEGKASIGESAGYKITDLDKLVDLFLPNVPAEHMGWWAEARASLAVVFEQVKLNKAFWEAAKTAHIKIETAAVPDFSERFSVEAHKTKDAKKIQERIIEETKYELQQRVEVLARRMMERNARSE